MKFNVGEFRHALLRMYQERGEEIPLTTSEEQERALQRERALILGIVHALDLAAVEDA